MTKLIFTDTVKYRYISYYLVGRKQNSSPEEKSW